MFMSMAMRPLLHRPEEIEIPEREETKEISTCPQIEETGRRLHLRSRRVFREGIGIVKIFEGGIARVLLLLPSHTGEICEGPLPEDLPHPLDRKGPGEMMVGMIEGGGVPGVALDLMIEGDVIEFLLLIRNMTL